MYTSLAVANPQSLRLIQECLSLENKLDCHSVTDLVLKADNNTQGLWGIKKLILDTDWKACLSEASQHQSTSLAAQIATHTTWPKLWDMHGSGSWRTRHTAALQALYRTLTRTSFGEKPALFVITSPPNYLILNTSLLIILPCQSWVHRWIIRPEKAQISWCMVVRHM